MFRSPTIITAAVLVIGSLLGTQASAGYDHASLLAAACKLKDTACAFDAINCQRPMTAYTLHQVKALRVSTEQFHEAVRCQASPAQLKVAFSRVCAFAARADARFRRSHNFRLDPEWSTAWSCVQNDIEAVRCLLQRPPVTASPSCGFRVGYGVSHHGNPYQPVPGFQDAGFPDAGFPDARLPNARFPNARLPNARSAGAGFPNARLPDATSSTPEPF